MKRVFYSFVALMLIFAFLCLHVSAAHVVGERGNTGTPVDGIQNSPDGESISAPIGVAVVDSVSKYAVDLTYPEAGIVVNYDGRVIWDVNNHEYTVTDNSKHVVTFQVVLTNHSDKSVIAYGKPVATAPFTMECNKDSAGNALLIAGVMSGATEGNEGVISLSVSPEISWEDTIKSIISDKGTSVSELKIGTLNVTVSMGS